jgi:hypothetical protein
MLAEERALARVADDGEPFGAGNGDVEETAFFGRIRGKPREGERHEVRFAVCGEFAVAYYGYIRSAYSPTAGNVSTSSSRVSAEGP